MIDHSKYFGYQYIVVTQCRGLINHAESEVIMTCRIENDNGKSMEFLESFNANPEIMKQIDIGDMDLFNAPIFLKKDKKNEAGEFNHV